MTLGRSVRKTVTFASLRVAMRLSQRSQNGDAVEAIRRGLLVFTRAAFPLRRRLERNMKLVGLYRPGLLDAHFERAVDQLCMIGHVMRANVAQSGCLQRFKFDDSFGFIEQVYGTGRGVIHIAPHICGYPLYAAVVSSRIPCSVYLRRNTDPRKARIDKEVGLAGEGELVIPPARASKAQRLQVAISVLRQGKMMFITPDTPRKQNEGVAVNILGRLTYFPIGVFVMSARTGAPVVPVFWHWSRGAYHVEYLEPLEISRGGAIRRQAEAATVKWAKCVDAFLREHPAIWWNWLDKRWTQIIRDAHS